MSRFRFRWLAGVGGVLVAGAIGAGALRGQHIRPSAGDDEGAESISLGSEGPVPIRVLGHYVRIEPTKGTAGSVHHVRAQGVTLGLDTSRYPGLKAYLDRYHEDLTTRRARLDIKGLLANAPADTGARRLICTVEEIRVSPGTEAATPAKAGAASKSAGPAPTEEDRRLADQINAKGGLTVVFDPKQDPNQSVLAMLRGAGLEILETLPSAGVIYSDVRDRAQVDADLIQKLRACPVHPEIVPRRGRKRGPSVATPPGERPFSTDRGRSG